MYIYDNNGQVQKIQTQENFIQPHPQQPQQPQENQPCQENFRHPHSKENYITTVIRENFELSSTNSMIMWSVLAVVVVAIIAGGGWYFYTHNKKRGSSSSNSGSSDSSAAPVAEASSSSAPEMAESAKVGFRFY